MDNRYYKHGGDFSLGGTLMSMVAGLAAGLLFAAAYSYATIYIPFMLLRILAPFGFGIGFGTLMGVALKKSNVRNNSVSICITAVTILISLYFSWVIWMYALISRDDVEVSFLVLLLPHVMIGLVMRINESGVWQYHGAAPSGVILWLIWLAEASVIVGGAIFSAVKGVSDPFCETCQQWCQKEPRVAEFDLGDTAELKVRMEGKDFEYLKRLNRRVPGTRRWYQLDIYNCPKCNQLNTLTVSIVTQTENRGQVNEQYKRIVNNLLITPMEAARLRKINEEIWQPAFAPEKPEHL